MAYDIQLDQWGRIGTPSAKVAGYLPMNQWRGYPEAERYASPRVGWMMTPGTPTRMPVGVAGYYGPHPYPAGVHGIDVRGVEIGQLAGYAYPGLAEGRNVAALLRCQHDAYKAAVKGWQSY